MAKHWLTVNLDVKWWRKRGSGRSCGLEFAQVMAHCNKRGNTPCGSRLSCFRIAGSGSVKTEVKLGRVCTDGRANECRDFLEAVQPILRNAVRRRSQSTSSSQRGAHKLELLSRDLALIESKDARRLA